MTEIFTVFEGERRLTSGPREEIVLAIKQAERAATAPIAIFSDRSGRAVDLDLRSSTDAIPEPPEEPRGRGRPKLGVVPREVTLLPRHWEWLNTQPGGASVTLRKLVDAARRMSGDADRQRAAREAAYHFMSASSPTASARFRSEPCSMSPRKSQGLQTCDTTMRNN